MRFEKLTLTGLFLCFCVFSAVAQSPRLLRGGIEISSNMVNGIFQDKDGWVWICTDNGLNRMDGAKNTVFYSEEDNNASFGGFFQDSKGRRFAVGSENVMLFDIKADQMKIIPAKLQDGSKQKIRAYGLIEMHDGTVLAYCAGLGIFRLEEEKDGTLVFRQRKGYVPYGFIKSVVEDSRHRLWASTDDGIVCCEGGKARRVTCDSGMAVSDFNTIIEDKDGHLWCSSDVHGVFRIDEKHYRMKVVSATAGMMAVSLCARQKGKLLIGTNGRGLVELNTVTGELKSLNQQIGVFSSSSFNVHSVMSDRDGNLWVGCYQKGIGILPNTSNRFDYIGPKSYRKNIIGNNCVQAVTCDRQGNLWVACDYDGLYFVKNNTDKSVHYAPSASMPRTPMSLFDDGEGHLWIGSWKQGLWVMNLQTGVCKPVPLPNNDSDLNVFAFADDGNGRIWIATSGNGMFFLDKKSGRISAFHDTRAGWSRSEHILCNNWINTLCMGKDNIMYYGTTDGVGAFDVNTQNCLRGFNGKNVILEGVNVNAIRLTADNRLWIGSSKGLVCYDVRTHQMHNYNNKEGIEGKSVMGIIDDHRGSLWISTNVGISRLVLKSGKIYNYNSNNGMYGNEFSRSASYLCSDGRIGFGGTEGVSSFYPDQVARMQRRPQVFITGLYSNGKSVNATTLSGGSNIIGTDILHCKEIEFAYEDNRFALELSSFNFVQSNSVQYEYRIDGDRWQSLPLASNIILFNRLSSGHHKIEVRAMAWNEYSDIRAIDVYIRSPWYATWWAWLFYIIIGAFVAYSITVYLLTRRQAYKNRLLLQQQEAISEAKMQFFMNISHEIRTPMTLIVAPLQRLLNRETDPQRRSVYQLMHRNAQRILQLVTQLLDVRKIDKGQMQLHFRETDIVEYVREIVSDFKDLYDTKKIAISFQSGQPQIKAWIDPLNFNKILINLIYNAFKYTPKEGRVDVTVDVDGDSYSIVVKDNGKGLSDEAIGHVFDRFYQQANENNNSVQGSGVGLNLTRSLVLMHHGEISVENNAEGGGCSFLMSFPLGNSHLNEMEMLQSEHETDKEAMPEAEELANEEAENVHETAAMANVVEKGSWRTRRNLLVVEDDEEIQNYLSAELSTFFKVMCVNNGEEALEAIRKHVPDLVISDVMMPVMDGLALLKAIRKNTITNKLPVILLTAKASEHDNIEGLDYGADAYITKPFNIEILKRVAFNIVQRQLQLKNIYDGRQSPKVDSVEITSPDERLMQRIMKVVNANLDNPELGNEIIMREVGISRVHLYRKLKELTNLSLRDFIKNIRLTEAARLLSEHHHSIAEVAARTGFDNVSYFTVVFKQKYGVPPSVYMNQEHNKEKE